MSMAEDIIDRYGEPDFYETDESIFRDYLLGMLFWTTKDKSKLHISQMTNSHIKNCMQRPFYPNKCNWDIVFQYELKRRDELDF